MLFNDLVREPYQPPWWWHLVLFLPHPSPVVKGRFWSFNPSREQTTLRPPNNSMSQDCFTLLSLPLPVMDGSCIPGDGWQPFTSSFTRLLPRGSLDGAPIFHFLLLPVAWIIEDASPPQHSVGLCVFGFVTSRSLEPELLPLENSKF